MSPQNFGYGSHHNLMAHASAVDLFPHRAQQNRAIGMNQAGLIIDPIRKTAL